MSANNVRAGGAFVEVFATTQRLKIDLAKAQTMTAGFAAATQRQLGQFSSTLFQPVSARMATLPAAAISSLGATLTGMGMGAGGIAATITVPLAAAGREAVEFEKQMAGVSTMLSDKSFLPAFREEVLRMSRDLGEGTTNLAVSLRELIGSAIAPADALGVLDVAARTARAGMVDTATASLLLANNINAFQLAASDAEDIADTLFTIVRNGVVTFEELTKHFGESTATANAAGISLQEAGAAFATMTRNGLKADLAVTALNGILAEFLKPSKDGAKVAAAFGLELSTAALRSKGLQQVIEELSALPADALARIFPDVRGLRGMLALRGDLKGFVTDLNDMRGRGGAMKDAFGIMSNTANMRLDQAVTAVRDLAIAVGDELLPMVEPVATGIRVVAFGIKEWVKENPKLVRQVAMLGAGLGVAAIGLVAIGTATSFAGAGLMAVLAPVSLLVTGVGLLVGGLLALPSLGVFGPIIAGVVTTLAYFGAFDRAVESTSGFMVDTFNAVGAWFREWGESFGATMSETWGGIVTAVQRGDLTAAVNIGTMGMEAAWADAIERLGKVWDDWTGSLAQGLEDIRHVMAHLAVDAVSLFKTMKGDATGDYGSVERAAGEISSGFGWYDDYKDRADKASAMQQYDTQRSADYYKQNPNASFFKGTGYNQVLMDPNSAESKRRKAFEDYLDTNVFGTRKKAREENAKPGGADEAAEAKRKLDKDHEDARLARQKELAERAAARAKEANDRKQALLMRLEAEKEAARVAAEAAEREKKKGGPRSTRPKGPGRPDIPMPEDLETMKKSAKLPTTGSFSIAALRGMVAGGSNAAPAQRREMIRLLKEITDLQKKMADEDARKAVKKDASRWVDGKPGGGAIFT